MAQNNVSYEDSLERLSSMEEYSFTLKNELISGCILVSHGDNMENISKISLT
jgi:hypothetical protein